MKRLVRAVALLLVMALVVAACSGEDDDATTTSSAGTGSPSTTGGDAEGDAGGDTGDSEIEGTFRIGMIANITTDNWWASIDTESQSQNQAYLTNSKVAMFDISLPGFVLIPEAAATDTPVDPVEEGDIWVVEQPIRDDLEWSDGEPLTAHDLVFYFDVVREFNLGSNHASAFGPTVLSVTAPDDHTVRIEFSERPGLAVWDNGVGIGGVFVAEHFWQEHVDAARAAAEAATADISAEDATQAIVEASLDNDNPDDDVSADEVTQEDIDAYLASAGAQEALTVLYSVSGVDEPAIGAVTVDQWENGAFAATVANPTYYSRGAEHTFYSDGSFQIGDEIYGGEGSGDVVAQFTEGPFVDEILWVEHGTKDAAYEKLAGGELDFVFDPTGLTSGLRSELATNPDLQFSVNQTEGFRYMAFNLRKQPMSDLAFRQAVATVINKELIADTVLAGAVFPGYTIVHPDLTLHYNEEVARPGWADGEPMDQGARFEEAIRILEEAGYTWETEPVVVRDDEGVFTAVNPKGEGLTRPDGEPVQELSILTPGPGYDPFRATFSVYIETWMQELGIPVTAEPTDFNAIVDATFPPQTSESAVEWDMYTLGWGGGDPSLPGTSSRDFFHSSQDAVAGGFNTPGYHSDEFDAIAAEFDAASTIEEAAELTKEMEAILARDLPYVVLFRTPIIEASRSAIAFPTDSIMGGQQGFPNAWPNAVDVVE